MRSRIPRTMLVGFLVLLAACVIGVIAGAMSWLRDPAIVGLLEELFQGLLTRQEIEEILVLEGQILVFGNIFIAGIATVVVLFEKIELVSIGTLVVSIIILYVPSIIASIIFMVLVLRERGKARKGVRGAGPRGSTLPRAAVYKARPVTVPGADIKYCVFCGKEFPEIAGLSFNFCPMCGKALPARFRPQPGRIDEEIVYCIRCGTLLDGKSRWAGSCRHCGFAIPRF